MNGSRTSFRWIREWWAVITVVGMIAIGYVKLTSTVKAIASATETNSRSISKITDVIVEQARQDERLKHVENDVADIKDRCCP